MMSDTRVVACLPTRWGSIGTTGVPFANLVKLFGVSPERMRRKLDELAAAGRVEQVADDCWIATP